MALLLSGWCLSVLLAFSPAALADDAAADGTVDERDENGCPIEHTHLISQAQSCCYAKLVKNPGCCLDEKLHKGVRVQNVSLKDAEWNCKNKTCYDTQLGRRGQAQMWIPEGATCSSPRVLYIHGGSWMYCSPQTCGYPQLASKLAAASGAVTLLIDYPLLPYGHYETILDASVQGLQWLAEHGPDESCEKKGSAPLLVGGDSSGGGSAMSLVLHLQANPRLLGGRQLDGAFFFSPWTNLMCNTPEYYTNAFATIKDSRVRFNDLGHYEQFVGDIIFQDVGLKSSSQFSGNALQYIGHNKTLQVDPVASSYFSTPDMFGGEAMPSLFFAVGASESIMGDTVRVANTAGRGGADVEVEVYSGMWHVFPMYSEGCGSGMPLWSGVSALNSTAAFVRRVAAGRKVPVTHGWPRLHHMYDPHLNKFEKVGELIPHRVHPSRYEQVLKQVEREPWWAVLSSLATSAAALLALGFLAGNLACCGGYSAYRRARRVAEYRKHFVEVPAGYISLEALHGRQSSSHSFITDFVRGVPDEKTWRVETARAKALNGGDDGRVEAARAENIMWRKMAMPSHSPPLPPAPAVQKALLPEETLEGGRASAALIDEVQRNVSETWAISTKEAKDGGVEAARRENMAWRLQHMESQGLAS